MNHALKKPKEINLKKMVITKIEPANTPLDRCLRVAKDNENEIIELRKQLEWLNAFLDPSQNRYITSPGKFRTAKNAKAARSKVEKKIKELLKGGKVEDES